MHYFAIYTGQPRARGHACIARAQNAAHALRAARSNGITLARTAHARALTVQEYADMLRAAGLTVTGVPEQLQLMACR